MLEREVGGDGREAGIDLVDRILLCRRGVEDEDGTLRRVVEDKERGDELGKAKASGENDKAAARVVQEVADYVLVKLYHDRSKWRRRGGGKINR